MLAGLARWLRVLGYDTAYEAEIADAELVRRGTEEGRCVLTRDRGLAGTWRTEDVLLLRSGDPLEQLREVADATGIGTEGIFTRCNLPLEEVPRDGAVAARLPESVRAARRELRGCPGCGRVYWEGSHTDRMRRAVNGALGSGKG